MHFANRQAIELELDESLETRVWFQIQLRNALLGKMEENVVFALFFHESFESFWR